MAKKTSPWVWVGVGCLIVILLMGACVVGLGYMGVRWGKQLEREISDPVLRAEKARQVLGCESFPEGYHPMISISIPLIMKMTILSDQAPDEEGRIEDIDERGFIYIQFIKKIEPEVKGFFSGETDDPSILQEQFINIDMDYGEIISRGAMQIGPQNCMFVAQRGEIRTDSGTRSDGIQSIILIECPDDQRTRVGIWFGPEPAPAEDGSPVDWRGTPADPEAVERFMNHFNVCGSAAD